METNTPVKTETTATAAQYIKCPSCGRETSSEIPRCGYCCTLTSEKERITVRSMNLSTIILFIAALIYFTISVTLKPSYMRISELNETRNFEHVRVLGKVKYVSEFKDKYKKRSTIQIELIDAKSGEGDDYEGKIKLKAEGEVAKDLKDKNLIPSEGDIVDISASLFAGKGYRVLSLGAADLLKTVGKAPEMVPVESTIAGLLEKPENFKDKKVRIKAAVITKRHPKLMIEVSDPDLKKSVIVFGADPNSFKDNQNVSISGKFVYYDRGEYWEIKVFEDDPNAIIPLN